MESLSALLELYIARTASLLSLELGRPAQLLLPAGWCNISTGVIDACWLDENLGLVSGAEDTWPTCPQHFLDQQLKWELEAQPNSVCQIRLLEGTVEQLCIHYLRSHSKLRIDSEQYVDVFNGTAWSSLNAKAVCPVPFTEFHQLVSRGTRIYSGFQLATPPDPTCLVFEASDINEALDQPEDYVLLSIDSPDALDQKSQIHEFEALVSGLVMDTEPAAAPKFQPLRPTREQLDSILKSFPGRKFYPTVGSLPTLILGSVRVALANTFFTEIERERLGLYPNSEAGRRDIFWRLDGTDLLFEDPFQSQSARFRLEPKQMPASVLAESQDWCLLNGPAGVIAYESSGQNFLCASELLGDQTPEARIGERCVVLGWNGSKPSLLGRIGLAKPGFEAHFSWTARGRRPRTLTPFVTCKTPELAWGVSPAGKYIAYLEKRGSKARLTRIDVDDDQLAGQVDLAIDLQNTPAGRVQIRLDEDGNCAILCNQELWFSERTSNNCARHPVESEILVGVSNLSAVLASNAKPGCGSVDRAFSDHPFPSGVRSKPKFCDMASLLSVVSLFERIELFPAGTSVGYRNHNYSCLPFIIPSLKALNELGQELKTRAGAPAEIECFPIKFTDCTRSIELRPGSICVNSYYFDGQLKKFPLTGCLS